MSTKKSITVTNGFCVDASLLSDVQWDELEQQLNDRELSTGDLASKLGMSKQELDNCLTHTETLILDC